MTETKTARESPPHNPDSRKKPGRRVRIVLSVAGGIVVIGVLGGLAALRSLDYLAHWRPNKEKIERVFIIERGSALKEIAQSLEKEGLARHWLLFAAHAFQKGVARGIQAGEYHVHTQMTIDELVEMFQHGRFRVVLTIPEGFTMRQIAQRAAEKGLAQSEEEFMALESDPELLRLAGCEGGTIEGYLFPDTYFFDESDTAESVARRMAAAFRSQFDGIAEMSSADQHSSLTPRELVILASMIEREARTPGEMASISSVYHNRLAKKMKLECCATVHHALNAWDRALTFGDLNVESPYNTYLHYGLPPAPICNPGHDALRAASQPADTDFLYYVYRGDGTHEFSRTFKEHQAASRKYRQPISPE
jgi:UPF0755 protein